MSFDEQIGKMSSEVPTPKTWGIIGLGWLGTELRKKLETLGHETWGTRRKDFDFDTDEFPTKTADILFLNTPPLIQMSAEDYVHKIQTQAKRIIFISSTSVYGANVGIIDEATGPVPKSESAKWLVEVEKKLRFEVGERLTVIRPGGLIGEDRHPVTSLAGRKNVAEGNRQIHLIHRQDLIEIILTVASSGACAILNAVTPHHPTKREYYTESAKKRGLPPPHFEDSNTPERRITSLILPQVYKTWKKPQLD